MSPVDTKVYFAAAPADFRKSFDGLAATAAATLSKDPAQGGLFVFLNMRGNQVRVLFRDALGWCLLSKRLDKGRFRRPRIEDGQFCWQTETRALMFFLDDIDFSTRRRQRTPRRYLEVVQP